MRARLHVEGAEGYDGDAQPIHLHPAQFFDDVPPLPSVDDTEDALRERDDYSVGRHRTAHAEAVADWRGSVRGRRRDTVTLRTATGDHEVRVAYLG